MADIGETSSGGAGPTAGGSTASSPTPQSGGASAAAAGGSGPSAAGGGTGATPSSSPSASTAQASGHKPTGQDRHARAREAMRRVEAGEKPETINASLYGRSQAAPTQAGAGGSETPGTSPGSQTPTPAQGQTAPAPQTQTTQVAGAEPTADELGLSQEEFSQLKRSKFHMNALRQIPPSNRKAIARGFLADAKEFTAAQDRAYAAAKQPGQAQTTQQTPTPSSQQANPSPAAQAPPQGQAQAAGEEAATSGTTSQAPSYPQGHPLSVLAGLRTLKPETVRTLSDLGGEEYARAMAADHSALVAGLEQALGPAYQLLESLAQEAADNSWERATAELAKTPGLESLTPEQLGNLRQASTLLLRAHGTFDYRKVVKAAAAQLFGTDIEKAVLAKAATSRQATVHAQIHPGSNATERKPLTGRDRRLAIARQMAGGLSGKDALAAVDTAS